MAIYTGIGSGLSEDRKVPESVVVKSGASTAAKSTPSPLTKSPKGKENLTGRDVLSILENSFERLNQYSGNQVEVVAKDSMPVIILIPRIIRYCPKCKHLRLSEDMLDDACRYCQI